jgi:hypothetical protein
MRTKNGLGRENCSSGRPGGGREAHPFRVRREETLGFLRVPHPSYLGVGLIGTKHLALTRNTKQL